jgi:hypothetical protein
VLLRESLKGSARRFGIQLSGLLPGGELKFVAGFPVTPYPDHEPIVDTIFEFFDVDAPATPREAAPSGMTAILFADIVDSTALTETMGDGAFREKARDLDTIADLASLNDLFAKRGYTKTDIAAILSGNFIEFLRKTTNNGSC